MPKLIKIVHIIPTLRFGGAERFVVDLINHCDPNLFSFSIITFSSDIPLAKELQKKINIRVVPKTNKLGWGLTSQLVKVLQDLKPDLVHTHLFGADVWGKRAAHQLGLPVITTEHNINVGESWLKNLIKKQVNKSTDAWVASSEAILVDLRNRYGLKQVISVIRYGIDLARWKAVPPLNYKLETVNFLILGRLVKQKGQAIALKALAQLQPYQWKLQIVGSGEDELELKQLTERLGLAKRVNFIPATSKVVPIMERAQVELVPSVWEGLGIVVMEALAAGRLVVASRVGGIPELLSTQTGYLVESGSVTAWKNVLEKILEQPFFIQKPLIVAGQKQALTHFGMEQMISAYQKIYAQISPK